MTIDQCVGCYAGSFLMESSCVAACPQGYYGNSVSCVACMSDVIVGMSEDMNSNV